MSDGDEACTDRDGLLSSTTEWHAFTHGVYLGFTSLPWQTPPEPENPDVAAEPHYYRGGYLLGTGCQLAMLAVASDVVAGTGVIGSVGHPH